MKKEDLFQGAIVLARKYAFKKRARCKIIDVGRSHSVVQDQRGYKFVTEQKDLRPAKITPKALIGLGFKWETSSCTAGREHFCGQYKYPDQRNIRVTLKENCNLWDSTVMFWQGVRKVSYIHEVQKFLSNQQIQKPKVINEK